MLLLRARNIQYSIGDRSILDIPELSIFESERIGLVGKNGAGKSTLLHLLSGEGNEPGIRIERFTEIAHVKQLEEDEEQKDDPNWKTLSGGERTVRKLDNAFAQKPGLLFLDEPTNNLDWKHIESLEQTLDNYKGALILVSHDRALLDQACEKIWELDEGKITVYKGNFTDYRKQKKIETDQAWEAYDTYTKEKKRLIEAQLKKVRQSQNMHKPPRRMGRSEWTLYKNKAAAKQKKVERVSKTLSARIERMENNRVEKPFEFADIKMEMDVLSPVYRKHVIKGEKLSKSYGGRRLYTIPSFHVTTGSNTALLGDNATGKTSLFRQILNREEGIDITSSAKIGVFEQNVESLDGDKTILETVQEGSIMPKHVVRIILGRLRFPEEDVHKRIAVLSGGERARVVFAKLLSGDYNVLMFDEPTNHLDVETVEALEELFIQYPGTILFISHDRRFVERVADQLLFLHDGTLTMFQGTYEKWKQSMNEVATNDDKEQTIMRLENRLNELIGKLSVPQPTDDPVQLDEEYKEVLKALRSLKSTDSNKKHGS